MKAWILPLPATVQEQLEEGVADGFDGMIVYVDQGGKAPEFYAAGWHDREKKIPAYPQALFKIASISKLYVAVAVAKLVKDGRLSLDETLADYLPELGGRIEYADKITLRMLVQHRSGIPDFTRTPNYWVDPPQANSDNLDLVLDKPADFAPDKSYGYSNTNYLLIGEILDKRLGYSHHQYIKEEIQMSLKLNNTYSLLSEVDDLDAVMSGYYVGYEADMKNNDFINPAGSMVATAEDVGIFLRALNDGSVFNEGEQEIYSSIYTYEHTGLLPGYQSIAKYHKEIEKVLIQFNNTTNFDGYEWGLAEIIYNRVVKIVKRNREE